MTDIQNNLPPADAPLIEAAHRLERGERFALVTVIRTEGSTPRKVGARMLVDINGAIFGTVGGAAVERIAMERAQAALHSGQVQRLELDLNDLEHMQTGMVCGGRMELLIEPFGGGPRLLLFGAGHVAQPTARLAREVGFEVVIHDNRPEWATAERFPNCQIRIGEWSELTENIVTTADDFIAIMTYCHDEDYAVLSRVLRKQFFYLGVIGSPRKAVEIRRRLGEDGFSQVEIDRMTCPIGLDIGSHTPAEIAVSIVGQLVMTRRKWEKRGMKNER